MVTMNLTSGMVYNISVYLLDFIYFNLSFFTDAALSQLFIFFMNSLISPCLNLTKSEIKIDSMQGKSES